MSADARNVAIESDDDELVALLRMWLGDAGYDVRPDGGARRIIDEETRGDMNEDAGALYIVAECGRHKFELQRPFTHTELMSAVRGAFSEKEGELIVDPVRHTANYRGDSVSLTGKEYAVMRLLFERGEEGVSREEISAVAKLEEGGRDTNACDVYVHHLRRKLEKLTGNPGGTMIRTLRGFGYALIID